jgi:hypothetical protein
MLDSVTSGPVGDDSGFVWHLPALGTTTKLNSKEQHGYRSPAFERHVSSLGSRVSEAFGSVLALQITAPRE